MINKYDENIVLTYKCKSCGITNRVISPKKGEKWKCGRCGTILLHRQEVFHESLILDTRCQLELMLLELKNIKMPIFAQEKIKNIEKMNDKFRSKIESWMDHLSYDKDKNKQNLIYESYKPDLDEIANVAMKISNEINDAKWLSLKFKNIQYINTLINSTGMVMKGIIGILSFLGLDEMVNLIENLITLRLEDLS